jgi:hypothetical protein
MAFDVSYIYNLVDNISPNLKKIQSNVSKLDKSISDSTKRMSRNFTDLGKKMTTRVTLPIGLISGAAIKAASDAEEISSKFSTVFKDISIEADKTANNIAKNFGISSVKAKELLGDTGDLLTGFGFAGDSALDLSKRVNELAVDLASFTNFSGGAEGASKALTKALLGERESVKSLGISILEKDVVAKIKSLAATGKLTGMTERQAKAYATLEIAIGQSQNAIGDFARTSASFANQSRILNQRLFDLRVSFGKIILPLATKLVGKLIELTEKFDKLAPSTKKFILIIAGLAAILPPLLILFGSLGFAITGFIATVKAFAAIALFAKTGVIALKGAMLLLNAAFLANPIGLLIKLLLSAIPLLFVFKDEIVAIGKNIVEFLMNPIEGVKNTLTKLTGAFSNIKNKFSSIFSGNNDNLIETASQKTINQHISSNFAGNLDINFNNAPSGMTSILKSDKTSGLNVGVNSIMGAQ